MSGDTGKEVQTNDDLAAIGAAFLNVLRHPSHTWHQTEAWPFISMVADQSGAAQYFDSPTTTAPITLASAGSKVYEYLGAAVASRFSEEASDHADKLHPQLTQGQADEANRLVPLVWKSLAEEPIIPDSSPRTVLVDIPDWAIAKCYRDEVEKLDPDIRQSSLIFSSNVTVSADHLARGVKTQYPHNPADLARWLRINQRYSWDKPEYRIPEFVWIYETLLQLPLSLTPDQMPQKQPTKASAISNDLGEGLVVAVQRFLSAPGTWTAGHADALQGLREAYASITAPQTLVSGWVVANADGNRFRYWENGPEWTDDRSKALTFVRKRDAETFAEDDEDAWKILPNYVNFTR